MHCIGNGKLLLNYSQEQLKAYIAQKGLRQFTPNTITTLDRLRSELERIRIEGFAYDNEECELGVRCIACPIRNYSSAIVAGVSITGPVGRMTEEALSRIRPYLLESSMRISEKFGFVK